MDSAMNTVCVDRPGLYFASKQYTGLEEPWHNTVTLMLFFALVTTDQALQGPQSERAQKQRDPASVILWPSR